MRPRPPRPAFLAAACGGALIAVALASSARGQGNPLATHGRWSQPVDWNDEAIHMALLRGAGNSHSQLVYWGGQGNLLRIAGRTVGDVLNTTQILYSKPEPLEKQWLEWMSRAPHDPQPVARNAGPAACVPRSPEVVPCRSRSGLCS